MRQPTDEDTSTHIADIAREYSQWVDDYVTALIPDQPIALRWTRLAKVSEERDEVIKAYIGVLGHNPRKGVYATEDDINAELCDVAFTALCALEHMTGNTGQSMRLFITHVVTMKQRLHHDLETTDLLTEYLQIERPR